MQDSTSAPASFYDKILIFKDSHKPPRAEAAQPSKVKPPVQREWYIGAGIAGGAFVLLLLVKLIGGSSFSGDILSMGMFGLLGVGLIYLASTGGAYFFSQKKSVEPVRWNAVAVMDSETRFEAGVPVNVVLLELEDGRQVTLKAESDVSDMIEPGMVGWANIQQNTLVGFSTQ